MLTNGVEFVQTLLSCRKTDNNLGVSCNSYRCNSMVFGKLPTQVPEGRDYRNANISSRHFSSRLNYRCCADKLIASEAKKNKVAASSAFPHRLGKYDRRKRINDRRER